MELDHSIISSQSVLEQFDVGARRDLQRIIPTTYDFVLAVFISFIIVQKIFIKKKEHIDFYMI